MKDKTVKKRHFLLVLCFVLFVSILGINFYQKFMYTPKKIFVEAITSLTTDYKYLYNIKNSNYNFVNDDFTYEGKLTFDVDLSLLNFLNNKYNKIFSNIDTLNNYDINYKLSKNNNEILLELNNKYYNNDLNLVYYKNNVGHYIKLNQYDEKFISIDYLIDKLKNNFILLENNEYLINFLKHSFFNQLKDDYFTTEKIKMDIDNEEVYVTKNILTLDKNNLTEILDGIISDIKSDEKILEILKDYININELGIDDYSFINDDMVIYFNTYVNNNKLIKYEFEFDNFTDLKNLVISFIKNENRIELTVDNNTVAYIETIQTANGYIINLYINDNKLLEINSENFENKKEISFISEILPNNNFNIKLSEILDPNVLEDYDKIENKLLLNLSLLGFNIIDMNITNLSKIYDYSNIEIDTSNSIEIDDLSNDNYKEIVKIFKNFIKSNKVES